MVAPAESGQRGARTRAPIALLIILALGLTAFGLVVLTSAGKSFHRGGDSLYIFRQQAKWLVFALLGGVFTSFINLDWVRTRVWWFFGVACVLMASVRVPGLARKVNGSYRWLEFGGVKLQVSDVGKIALVLALAHYLAKYRRYFCPPRPPLARWRAPWLILPSFRQIERFPWLAPVNDQAGDLWYGFLGPVAIIGGVCGLIAIEPDLGTTALCGAVGFVMIFTAGVRQIYIWPLVVTAVTAFSAIVYIWPNRLARVASFLDPEGLKGKESYQLWQGFLGFGVGGLFGSGLGQGMQQEYYLPEAHTDFIFAIVAEELGLVATVSVILAYILFFWVVVSNLRKIQEVYRFNICLGAMLLICLQALINTAVVTGLLPTKGMSLPFISYGGTNLVMMFALVGLILNCLRTGTRIPLGGGREIQ